MYQLKQINQLNTYRVSADDGSIKVDFGLYVTNNEEEAILLMLDDLLWDWDGDLDLVQIEFVDSFPGPGFDTSIKTYSIYIEETEDEPGPLPSLHYPETCYVELLGAEPVNFMLGRPPAERARPQSIDRKPEVDWIDIEEGQSGFSYKNLFWPYLRDSVDIKIQEPYITSEDQMRNFNKFCEILDATTNIPPIQLNLITAYCKYDHQTVKKENIWMN